MIAIGTIRSEIDFLESGTIKVLIDNIGEEPVEYTSPMKGTSAGFVAVPKAGARVIVCKPDNISRWYYVSTISGPSRAFEKGSLDTVDSVLGGDIQPYWSMENPYLRSIVPQVIGMVTSLGAGMVCSDSSTPNVIRRYTTLKSGGDHCVVLSDDPKNQGVTIKTNQGTPGQFNDPETKIVLTGKDTEDLLGPNGINIQAKRNIWFESRFGNWIQRVFNGGRMLISNSSRSDSSDAEKKQDGEIQIQTYHNDIHICVKNNKKNVIIESWGDGKVQVYAHDVQVRADGNIHLDAEDDIHINAGGNVNIDAGSDIYLNSQRAEPGDRIKSNDEQLNGSLTLRP